jgi:hypothetical protein
MTEHSRAATEPVRTRDCGHGQADIGSQLHRRVQLPQHVRTQRNVGIRDQVITMPTHRIVNGNIVSGTVAQVATDTDDDHPLGRLPRTEGIERWWTVVHEIDHRGALLQQLPEQRLYFLDARSIQDDRDAEGQCAGFRHERSGCSGCVQRFRHVFVRRNASSNASRSPTMAENARRRVPVESDATPP